METELTIFSFYLSWGVSFFFLVNWISHGMRPKYLLVKLLNLTLFYLGVGLLVTYGVVHNPSFIYSPYIRLSVIVMSLLNFLLFIGAIGTLFNKRVPEASYVVLLTLFTIIMSTYLFFVH